MTNFLALETRLLFKHCQPAKPG